MTVPNTVPLSIEQVWQLRPWTHPAIEGKHIVSRTREGCGGVTFSVATCQCGWTDRIALSEPFIERERAISGKIDAHWRAIISASEA